MNSRNSIRRPSCKRRKLAIAEPQHAVGGALHEAHVRHHRGALALHDHDFRLVAFQREGLGDGGHRLAAPRRARAAGRRTETPTPARRSSSRCRHGSARRRARNRAGHRRHRVRVRSRACRASLTESSQPRRSMALPPRPAKLFNHSRPDGNSPMAAIAARRSRNWPEFCISMSAEPRFRRRAFGMARQRSEES